MTRRRGSKIMNAVILLALVLVIVMTARIVTDDDTAESSADTTVTVDTGTVSATVSASGNTAAATSVDVSFEGTGGIVRQLNVKEGEKVRKGQVLAVVDQTSARQTLASARAQLASAQASYATTTQGLSSAERAQNATSIASAETSVRSAEVSLRAARATYSLDRRQQNTAVRRAEHALASAAPDQKASARAELIQARNSRDSLLLQDRQHISSQEVGLASANDQLASARASAAVTAQAPRSGELQAAQAQIDSAQVVVDQARTTYDQTVLCAPVGGTVASVNGAVGQSSSSSSSSSDSSTTDDSSSSTGSAFIVLTSKNLLEVTAYVAEADIIDVEVGQSATVTLSASGTEIAGEVTSVDTNETITNNVVEYGVTVRLDKAKGVRLGQTSELVISTGEKEGVTRVSSSALTTIGARTTATVQREDGSTETVVVTTGLEGDSQTEILSGLVPGDTVVIPQQEGSDTGFTFPDGGPGGGPVGGIGGAP
jgi:multidrug efflux pump subunit AcrA (membrane-fusion protein)